MIDKTPSERRYEKTRQGILDAARSLLQEGGVEAVSMRSLAEKVDYSPAALYKYFSNKEEIIEALRQEAWELMANFEPDMPPGLSMAEMFVLSGQNYVKFATRYPEYYLLVMSTTETGPESMEEFKQMPSFINLLQFTEAAIGSGQFILPEGYTPTHFALLAWFVVHGISLLKLSMMSKCADEFETASFEVLNMIQEIIGRD
ncbi:MAG: TetR/AcrR family transcriptional regulator [Anaerolineales bacterium]|nr:TetR/AcrR family transcriptional regulator [Anaerolineales bacterium]